MFARSFCRSEGIRVVAENVLGTNGRVVMLDSAFNTVSKTIINRSMDERLANADRELEKIINKTDKVPLDNAVTLF